MTFSAHWTALASLLVVGCQGGAAPLARKVVPHRLLDCEVEENGLVLAALGDFGATHVASVRQQDIKKSSDLDLPLNLMGVEASTSPPALRGIGYADPPADVHLTMWSTRNACRAVDGFFVPPSQGGQAMTVLDGGGSILVAGLDPGVGGVISDAAFAFVWDTRTGASQPRASLKANRVSWASATPFDKGALIAGGLDRKYFPVRYLDSALVLRDGDIQLSTIPIGDPRARHGAVVLASGATLLVGGEDDRGVIDTLVSIAPTETPPYGVANFFMLASLARARKLPTVLRLATDEIFVAGGLDASGNYVPTLEWFSKEGGGCPDGPCSRDPAELAGLSDLAFVALTAGGVLAAGGIVGGTGAPANGVFWISANGAVVERLASLTAQQRGTKRVRLVSAGNGAPWLWNGDAWFRFDPWQNAFVAPDDAPDDGPDDDLPPPLAVDPGLFVWLSRRGNEPGATSATLRGFRHGMRGPYTHDPDFLLADPSHLAPSRPPRVDGELWADTEGLHLAESAHVVIADATFGNVVVSGEASGALPAVELGAWTIGPSSAAGCPWPAGGPRFTVTRSGRTVLVKVDDGTNEKATSCTGPEGRVTVGLHGLGSDIVTVKRLTVERR